MAASEEDTARQEATTSLERVQQFDAESLPREVDLGTRLNFKDAVEPARRLIDLHQRLAVAALQDFPAERLRQVKDIANESFNYFNQILTFNPDQGNPQAVKQQLIQQLTNAYPNAFNVLHPLIAYSLHRSADFQRLDREARSTLQGVQDKAGQLSGKLEEQLKDAQRIVEEVRKVAAETGVSQQASYFKAEADGHESAAEQWRSRTVKLSWLLGVYGLASFAFAKIPFIAPADTYQSIQLGVSKVLVFAVLSFMLYLSARSFLSHKHNAVVNRHRQNALLTYRALADAAAADQNREVILTHAAACIFSPQPTGYSNDGGDAAKVSSVVEVFGKPFAGA